MQGNPDVRSDLFLCDFGLKLPMGNTGRYPIADMNRAGVLNELAFGVKNQRVPTVEDGERRKGLQGSIEALGAHTVLQEDVPGHRDQGSRRSEEFLSHSGKDQAQVVVTDGGGDRLPAA